MESWQGAGEKGMKRLKLRRRSDHNRKKNKKIEAIYKREWDALSPKQKAVRQRALDVLSEVRRNGRSVTAVAREIGTSVATVIRHTNALVKMSTSGNNRRRNERLGGRWFVKSIDKVSRPAMRMNEDGNEVWIRPYNSRDASLMGQYENAVKDFLHTLDKDILKPWKGRYITDRIGNKHYFEADSKKILEIQERKEDTEFHDGVYGK
jgi:hypothetical protein